MFNNTSQKSLNKSSLKRNIKSDQLGIHACSIGKFTFEIFWNPCYARLIIYFWKKGTCYWWLFPGVNEIYLATIFVLTYFCWTREGFGPLALAPPSIRYWLLRGPGFLLPTVRESNIFTGICLSKIGLMPTDSLLGLVTVQSVRILLECFLVRQMFWLVLFPCH